MNKSVKMLVDKKANQTKEIDLDAYAKGLTDMYEYLRGNNKGLEPLHFDVEVCSANRFREIANKLKISKDDLFIEMLQTHSNFLNLNEPE